MKTESILLKVASKTNMFNHKNWSVGQEIKKRVNKESEVEYFSKLTLPPLPKFMKVIVKKNEPGWVHFVLQTLRQLRP